MLGSPFSTNRAKAVLEPSPAPPTNKASLPFWLVQILAAKKIIGGDNLPCGFLALSVGFWRDFQHVIQCYQLQWLNPNIESSRNSGLYSKLATLWHKFVPNNLINLYLLFTAYYRRNLTTAITAYHYNSWQFFFVSKWPKLISHWI